VQTAGLNMDDLCNKYLHAKQAAVKAGELAPRTWLDYKVTCELLLEHFGRTRLVSDITQSDMAKYRAKLAETRGPNALTTAIAKARGILKYAHDQRLIPAAVELGDSFSRPGAKALRKARLEKGPKMFEAAELRRMLDAADACTKAMILLGVNCGYGNSDIGRLPLTALDLAGGWANYHREKTWIPRRAKLWPETVEAVKAWLAERPEPKNEDAAKLVFVDVDGSPMWDESVGQTRELGKRLMKLLGELEIKGRSYYHLRHTFETIGGDSRDQIAVNHVMGHIDRSMASVYRERISDDRLSAVAEHVRAWLWPDARTAEK
jgi:integrase